MITALIVIVIVLVVALVASGILAISVEAHRICSRCKREFPTSVGTLLRHRNEKWICDYCRVYGNQK